MKKAIGWLLVIAIPFVIIFGGGFLISLGLPFWIGVPIALGASFAVGWYGIGLAKGVMKKA